ncbi:MAG: DUF4286 family protein [Ginsengibacter sp.]
MYVLNISSKVDHSVITEWIEWQKNKFIPSLMATGLIHHNQFYKLLAHDDDEGAMYILQLQFTNSDNLQNFISKYDNVFMMNAANKWGDKFISFTTTLKLIGN